MTTCTRNQAATGSIKQAGGIHRYRTAVEEGGGGGWAECRKQLFWFPLPPHYLFFKLKYSM